jgi:ADP-heptose:LPS heptosyltransferase
MSRGMRILIIRFSSFGDIFQALEAAAHIKRIDSSASIDWLVRSDFAPLLENQKSIEDVISFDRTQSAFELVATSWHLAPKYDRVYDAHSNLRSLIVRIVIRTYWLTHLSFVTKTVSIIKRPKDRIRRLLFFKFRLPVLPKPFKGAESFLRPLRTWYPQLVFNFDSPVWNPIINRSGTNSESALVEFQKWSNETNGNVIAFAPSAAWPNKRWPIDRWLKLAKHWRTIDPTARFVLLGGPEDLFLNEVADELGPKTVFNSVGKSTLLQSAQLLSLVDAVVANDTGLLHVADRVVKPSVAIIGPTAFGYPSSPLAKVAETELACKPCSKDGRDPCTNPETLKCLKMVTPENVATLLDKALRARNHTKYEQGQ